MNHAKATLLCFAIWASQGAAQTTLGNELFQACSLPDNLAAEGYCLGYVVGAVEGLKWGAATAIAFVTPEELGTEDLVFRV